MPRKVKCIHIHNHIGTFYWGREMTANQLVRMMDRHDIETAVILPLVSPESAPYLQTTEAALAAPALSERIRWHGARVSRSPSVRNRYRATMARVMASSSTPTGWRMAGV